MADNQDVTLAPVEVTAPRLTYTQIDGPYGKERVPVQDLPKSSTLGGTTVTHDGPAIQLDNNLVQNDLGFNAATAARTDRANFLDSTALEGAGAAIMSWDTTRLIKRLTRPSFANDEPISQFDYLEHTPLALDDDEREYFMDVGKGKESAAYAIQQIEDRRLARRVVGEHEVAGMATAFIDPLWLAIPPALRIGKMSTTAGRAVAGISAAGLAGGVTAAGEGPVNDSEIALSMAMNGAIGAVLFKQGKGLVPKDVEFPAAQLDETIKAAEASVIGTPMTVRRMVTPEQFEEFNIPETMPVYKAVDLGLHPKVESSKPRYSYGAKQFGTTFESPIDKAAYIVAGKGKSAFHADILDWAKKVSGATEEQIVARGTAIRAELKVQAKESNATILNIPKSAALEYRPVISNVLITPGMPASSGRRKIAEAVYEDLPIALQPGAVNSDQSAVVNAVEKDMSTTIKPQGIGHKLQLNMHKTMSEFGVVGKKVADLLYDNNSDLSINSIESHYHPTLRSLSVPKLAAEDLIRESMAKNGAGLLQQVNPWTARKARMVQSDIEKQVQREMFRREQYTRQGIDLAQDAPNPMIGAIADQYDNVAKLSLKEMKAAGVEGAENLLETPGWLHRKWNSSAMEDVITKFESAGITREAAHRKLTGLVGLAIRRANNMDKDLANQIGQAIVDRTMRKGYFEDVAFNAPAGEGQIKQLRDILKSGGTKPEDIERALNVLRVETDEAGKAGYLKHRMDVDYKATVRVGNHDVSIMDLIDSNVVSSADLYTKQVATNVAFARKGFKKASDVEALRTELLHDVPAGPKRDEAKELFDNSINTLRGLPAGAAMNKTLRLVQAYGRAITLAWSGLYQMTETATIMGRYGLMKTLKFASQELPGFKQLASPTKDEAGMLNNILADHSAQSLRLRPFLSKFEDGYDAGIQSGAQLSAQAWGDLVPMANAMKYVHHFQAKLVGNLIVDRLDQAAKGSKQAREALQSYGIEAHVMDRVAADIKQHGFKVDNWSDKTWADVRPALTKMMDEAVLRERLGDMPAFAKFDQVGKFIFTYRSFLFIAHNKVLAGMSERNGASAVGLILLYQLPLAMLAIQAQNGIKGGKPLSNQDLVEQSIGQMGGLGLFSEPFKWASGQSNSIGAPALIPVDRAIKAGQSVLSGNAANTASAAMTMLPVVSAVPFINGMAKQIKE